MHRRPNRSSFLFRPSLFCAVALVAWLTPAAAASGAKSRRGPLCLPVTALLNEPAAGSPDPSQSSSTGQPSANPAPINHDVCVRAHVYQVVELPDGTRFLDVCPANIPDADCRFILLSLPADREEVGDLRRLSGADIQLRGTLRPMHQRFGIYLTHARQLEGGPEKFRPNPRLLRDFDSSSDRLPVRDPNLRSTGQRRSFMNRNLKEPATP